MTPTTEHIALVTGASTGLGYEIALELARSGYHVIAGMRDPAASKLDLIAQHERLPARAQRLDVTDDSSVRGAVEATLSEYGRIDMLVNNAGISGGSAIETTPLGFTQRVFETNVYGSLRMIQAVLPGMRERGSGTIVQVSSVAGKIPRPFGGPYSASKHAIEAYAEALHFEVLPFGVRVLIVEPSLYRTNLVDTAAGTRLGPSGSPYRATEERLAAAAAAAMSAAPPAREGARGIVTAALDGSRRLRYPIGAPAAANLAKRHALSEAEWAETMAAALAEGGMMSTAHRDVATVRAAGRPAAEGADLMVRVTIDANRCQGHGRCYSLSPEVFDADDEGHGRVIRPEVEGDLVDRARVAEGNCPEQAVIVSEAE